MKAPNGYGQVNHLGGKRRKPWQVRYTIGYKPNAKGSLTPLYKTVGYYATRAEAFAARDEFNRKRALAEGEVVSVTVGEVYEMWKAEHYPEVSQTTVGQYDSAYKHILPYSTLAIRDITYSQLQGIVNSGSSFPSRKNIKVVLNQMWKFAFVRGYVDKNLASELKVGKPEDSTLHFTFTADEIVTLWANRNDFVDFTLCLIYTGMRSGELIAMRQEDVTPDALYVPEGKTVNAKRYVPIHPDIRQLVAKRLDGGPWLFTFNGRAYEFPKQRSTFIRQWNKAMEEAGVLWYEHPASGRQAHKPHDGRHTFTSFWKSQRLDEGMRRYIQGHAGQGTGERVYTHYDLDALNREVERLVFLR